VKHLLSIAGSDSSGGAGVQADLKTFSALGVYGMTAIAALTAQNTRGVTGVYPTEPEALGAQIDAVFDDIVVDAVKIGMLGNEVLVAVVAGTLARWKPPLVVLDPVMVAKGGHHLLAPEAVEALVTRLLPLCHLVTPNLPEAEVLCGLAPGSIATTDAMVDAGRQLVARGAGAALVKGGHLTGDADDVLVWSGGVKTFPGTRLDGRHTHGTGCSLSSAVASLWARGHDLPTAVGLAKAWVAEGIRQGLAVGQGCGPIHHFHEFYDVEGGRR
jgi:hydroxymethylpyrimidine/phosphomethylpyrimidine kinase